MASHAFRDKLRIVTGGETGTYIQFGNDIRDAAAKPPYSQHIDVLKSNGSIDNIKRITDSGGTVQLGIVQSDILGFLARSTNKDTKNITKRLSLIFPFYEEEVHILGVKRLQGLKDLNNARIIVGQEGSGNMLTAMNILALAEIRPAEIMHTAPEQGVLDVLSGKADAMIFVGGKPVALFDNLAELKTMNDGANAHLLDNVHLVPIDDQRVFTEYSPTRISAGDYPFVDKTLLTAKVTALLVAHDPEQVPEHYCSMLQTMSRAVADNIDALKKNGHPKWKQVDVFDEIMHWKRHHCVWKGKQFLPAATATVPAPVIAPKIDDDLSKDLLDLLKRGNR